MATEQSPEKDTATLALPRSTVLKIRQEAKQLQVSRATRSKNRTAEDTSSTAAPNPPAESEQK